MIEILKPAGLFAAVVLLSVAAWAEQGVIVEQAWSRAALAGRNGAVFLTIKAVGSPDRLIAVTSPIAEKVELHESTIEQGVMKMREVRSVPMAAEQSVTLMPSGRHIMLMRLKQALNEGDRIPLTLTFENAGSVEATAIVAKAGAPRPMDGKAGEGGHTDHKTHE
jgi:copper(I)-binding protein